MFVKREKTETDRLRKKKRTLIGKNIQDKFKNQLSETLKKLARLDAFDKYFDKTLKNEYQRVIEDHQDLIQTTSNESKLDDLILCDEDIVQLLDDMTHNVNQGTYDERLRNVLSFLKDFQNTSYIRVESFYEGSSSKFSDQLSGITKDIQYKLSKMTHQVKSLNQEMKVLEADNIQKVKSLEDLNKQTIEYKELTRLIQDQHETIEMHNNTVNVLRKSMRSFRLLSQLFSQLSLLDDYYQYLKEDGYIRKLVKKLYRKPESLDVLDNTVDLVEAIQTIKEEIMEVEAVVKPSKKMLFDDVDEDADEAIINKYKEMAQ